MPSAPIDVLTPLQIKDIQASEGPHSVFRGKYRIKQYVKPSQMLDSTGRPIHPSLLPFPQPFQAASAWLGSSWNVTNRTFLGQLHGCNLPCPYCYVDRDAEAEDVGADDYVLDWVAWNKFNPEAQAWVLRISGGEPMLYQSWVEDVIEFSREYLGLAPYIWVDTNGTVDPDRCLLEVLSWPGVGVNLCFKYGVDLGHQLSIARTLIDAGVDTYFYVPAWLNNVQFPVLDPGWDFRLWLCNIAAGLRDISEYAPLRVTVIHIKPYQTCLKQGFEAPCHGESYMYVHNAWANMMSGLYRDEPEILWLPSNQVPL